MKRKAILTGILSLGLMGVAPAQQPGAADDLAPNPLFGDPHDWPDFAGTRAQCAAVSGRTPPAADRPGPAARRSLAGCDAEALYYGIGMQADPVRARQCAFLEAERGLETGFSGNALLMTIYANGNGARRDLGLAMHFACSLQDAAAERQGRVARLAALRTSPEPVRNFHFCDDITSGAAGGQCAAHGARIAAQTRARALATLTARYRPAGRRAYAALVAARDAFLDAHADGEAPRGGTAAGALWIEARETVSDSFLETLRRLDAGRLPGASFTNADRALNAAYAARRRALAAEIGDGEPSPFMPSWAEVRRAQRAWLRYRDAFLAFAAAAYPTVPRGSLAARLTTERRRMLDGTEDGVL